MNSQSARQKDAACKTVVLWDIDKTITVSGGLPDLFLMVLNDMLGAGYDGELPDKDGKTDSQCACEYLAAAHLKESLLDEFLHRLESLSAEFFLLTSLGVTPGVSDALSLLKKIGVVNGVYTGNTPARARLKLEAAGLRTEKLFDPTAWYCHGYEQDRFTFLERVREDYPDARLLVVGDSPADLEVARRLETPFWHVGNEHVLTYPQMMGESTDFSGESLFQFIGEVSRYSSST